MQWSKLRSHLLDLVAPELRKRIDFHWIKYRKLGDDANEFLVTIDGKKIFSASYSNHNIATYIVTRKTGMLAHGDGPEPRAIEDLLHQREVHAPFDITSSIRTYFDLEPRISLHSSDPILRALAMIDKRIGKRTLETLEISENEHSLIKTFYRLRMESLGKAAHPSALGAGSA